MVITRQFTVSVDKPALYIEQSMQVAETGKLPGFQIAVYTSPSPDREGSVNEDAAACFVCNGKSGVLVVADGLGGHPAGAQASSLLINTLQHIIDPKTRQDQLSLREAILDGIELANNELLKTGSGSATTAAVVEFNKFSVRPYHVGDTGILVTGLKGTIKLQTVSHSPIGYAVESGLMEESEAIHHEERHLVSNLVGAQDMSIEIGPLIELARYDTLLLASDGLFDNLYLEEIVEFIRKGPMKKVTDRLIHVARKRMLNKEAGKPSKPDDMTFILLRRSN